SKHIDSFELNKLVKRKPGNVILWSLLAPGLGYLHINRLPAAILFTLWFIAIFYNAHVLPAVHATMVGDLAAARYIDVQWFLYIPSLYGFVLYDAYTHTVEYNRLFRLEQAAYFRR